MSGRSDAVTALAVALAVSSVAACTGYTVTNKDRMRNEAMNACVSAGGEWIQTWSQPECRRPNTQTEQEP